MKTTAEYMQLVKKEFHLPSDYAVAKKLGFSRQAVSKYVKGQHTLSDQNAIHVAELLGIDPEIVLIDMQIEREQRPEVRAAWKSIAHRLSATAAAIVVGLVQFVHSPVAEASVIQQLTSAWGGSMYIM